ncbi:hypothetical protein BGZ93_000521, partial [Podila epicladia]
MSKVRNILAKNPLRDIHGTSLQVELLLMIIIEYSSKALKTLKALQLVGKVFLDKALRTISQDPLHGGGEGDFGTRPR